MAFFAAGLAAGLSVETSEDFTSVIFTDDFAGGVLGVMRSFADFAAAPTAADFSPGFNFVGLSGTGLGTGFVPLADFLPDLADSVSAGTLFFAADFTAALATSFAFGAFFPAAALAVAALAVTGLAARAGVAFLAESAFTRDGLVAAFSSRLFAREEV